MSATAPQWALAQRRHGRELQEAQWKTAEVAALYTLDRAGVRVPKPYGVFDGVLLMELVADEQDMPPGVAIIAHMLLCGLEQSVGRTDLALGHLQVALHRAAGLPEEESLLRLLLVGVLLGRRSK